MSEFVKYSEGLCVVSGTSYYPVPFELRDCGKYGLQLYVYRMDCVERYSVRDIVDRLSYRILIPPRPLSPRMAYRTDRQGD